ncbi:hypothetical protein [Streptomyces rimosus]|uniref:hypothetical protein n=1 Tax=Streptomyces rimosus TaxID=1927 RepID=UPI0037D8F358
MLTKDSPLLPDAEVRRRVVGLKRHLQAATDVLSSRAGESPPHVLRLLLARSRQLQQETPTGPMGPTMHMIHLAEVLQHQVRYLEAGPNSLNRASAPSALVVTARSPQPRPRTTTPQPCTPPPARRRRGGYARRAAALVRRHPGAAVLTAVVCLPTLYGISALVTVLRA